MFALHGRGVEDLLTKNGWKQEGSRPCDSGTEKRSYEIRIGAWSHDPRNQLCERGLAPVFSRIGNLRVREAMLIVNRNYGQAFAMAHMTAEGFEIGDYQVNLPCVD